MTTTLEKNTARCPHCGAEPIDDDELCKFCGKAMVAVESVQSASTLVSVGLRSLKAKIRPMDADDDLEELFVTSDYSNPANPIWED